MDFAEAYRSLPIVTRTYVTLCVLATVACALDVSVVFRAARLRLCPLSSFSGGVFQSLLVHT